MLAKLSRCFSIVCIGLALAAVAGFEARAQMSAPLVGLMGSESPSPGGIRPVLGVMGASSIQAPTAMPREISRVYLAPTGGWALVQQSRNAPGRAVLRGARPAGHSMRPGPAAAQLGLVTFDGAAPGAVRVIADAASNPRLVSFSPLGRSAALLAASTVIQVLTGLDSNPRVAFEAAFHDPSGVKKIAVSDDGQLLAVLTAAGQVFMLSNSIAPVLVCAASPTSGIAFLPNQSTAVIADAGSGTINLASLPSGAPAVRAVAEGMSSSGGEMLVEASRDGASAFVVEAGSASARRVDLTTGSTQSAALPAVATRLERLRDGESFVFSAEPGRSAWFLIGRDFGLQAVFAAAASTTEVSGQ
jgi:DNA-binding beta-propeller fold protein YncE